MTRESSRSRALVPPSFVGTLARAAGRFALTGELPERPDVSAQSSLSMAAEERPTNEPEPTVQAAPTCVTEPSP